MNIISHRHTGIVCKNIDVLLDFYHNILSLDILYHELEKDDFFQKLTGKKSAEIYKLGKENNIFLELLSFDNTELQPNKLINDTGITHICLNVSNLSELYFELSNKKIIFINEPLINNSKTAKVCFCYDPEGNLLEFVESL
jgi:catechol 2,3-dioxygenase-like lactoylglutathione lyase family enzyme